MSDKVKVKNGDTLRMWNGSEGTVSDINMTTYNVTIENENTYPYTCHKMNIRYVNGIEVPFAQDIVF